MADLGRFSVRVGARASAPCRSQRLGRLRALVPYVGLQVENHKSPPALLDSGCWGAGPKAGGAKPPWGPGSAPLGAC